MAQNDLEDSIKKDAKEAPSKVADSLTLGPQRRAASKYIQDEENKASGAMKEQWDQFKYLMSKPEPQKKQQKSTPRKRG